MTPKRHGFSLVETIMALALGAMVVALAVRMSVLTYRSADVAQTQGHAVQELTHGAASLRSDLQGAGITTVLITATALEMYAPVLWGVVCERIGANTVFLLASGAAPALRAVHRDDPRAGDRLVWRAGDSAYTGGSSAAVDTGSVYATLTGATRAAGCATSVLRGNTTDVPWRLDLPAGTGGPAVGSPVEVQRRTEWRLYQTGNSEWYLGRNEWTGSAWSGIQPVVGPLASPSLGALFTAQPSAIDVTLRALRPAFAPGSGTRAVAVDSLWQRMARRGAP